MSQATTDDIRAAAKKLFWAAKSMEAANLDVAQVEDLCESTIFFTNALLFLDLNFGMHGYPMKPLRGAIELMTNGRVGADASDEEVLKLWRWYVLHDATSLADNANTLLDKICDPLSRLNKTQNRGV